MKTLDQIICYTSHCNFPEEDWLKVLSYCRELFGGGKIHKSLKPISDSSYDQFIYWIEHGFGAGDLVSYGRTQGMIGIHTPFKTVLAAYCDYEGNLIVKPMTVMDVDRLKALCDVDCQKLKRMIQESGHECCVRHGRMTQLYRPEKYLYVSFYNGGQACDTVGLYLESEGCSHHFAAFLEGDKLRMDCWIDCGYTPLQPAAIKDVNRLHKTTSKAGWSFNSRTNTFSKQHKRGHDNLYWYMNESLEIVMDKDNGSERHTRRYRAGNYFIDQMEAITFGQMVNKIKREIK